MALSIAIITNNFTPYSGGVVSSILSFSNQLRLQGHRVIIITLDFLGNQNNNEPHVIRLTCPIKSMKNGKPISIAWRATSQILHILKEQKIDIIHVQHPFLLGAAGLKAGKKLSIPVIFTYHTLYEHYAHHIPIVPKKVVRTITKYLLLSFTQNVDQIIAPSTHVKKYLQANNIKTPIKIIPSPLLDIFKPLKSKEKRRGGPFKLLTVSRFEKEKNIPFLLEMFTNLNRKKFLFNLVGYGEQLEALREYAYNELGLDKDAVCFINHPAKNELVKYYQEADLFIFASQTETQGLVLAESMACGTPVVALYGPGQEDIVKNRVNGFLVSSIAQMINKIELLSADQNLHSQLRTGAILTSHDYAPELLSNKLVALYKSLIK